MGRSESGIEVEQRLYTRYACYPRKLEPHQSSPLPPRVCAVSFLNTSPLVWGMLHGPQRNLFDLSFAVPSECADRVARGESDIGILPVVEVERLGLEAIPGTGIACRGAVRSILLISKVQPSEIRTLAADTSSRTSVMLTRVILAERYGCMPALVPHAPVLEPMLAQADAALIIGDPALHLDPAQLPFHVLDLGAEWEQMTSLPMVFAIWAGPKAVVTPDLPAAFLGSYLYGAGHLDDVIRQESAARGIPAGRARTYLPSHIHFELGEPEYKGMRLFLDKCGRLESAAAPR
jgi:chorismate dehydratase